LRKKKWITFEEVRKGESMEDEDELEREM